MLFPVDADQAHYLTVMTNRWRWRTPSPGYDSSDHAPPSPAPSPAPSPHKPSSSRSSTASPLAGFGPAHPKTRPAPRDAVAAGDLDGVALTRCGLVVGEGEGAPLGDGQVPSPAWIEASDRDAKPGGDEASGSSEAEPGLKTTKRDDDEDDEDDDGGDSGAGGLVVDVVVSLDSSRAASLTRTCKWAGYKKVIHTHVRSDSTRVFARSLSLFSLSMCPVIACPFFCN